MVYSGIFFSKINRFKDRFDAGDKLASKLLEYKEDKIIILALPRGGVPLGYKIAKKLNAPLSIVVSRKIGAPGQEEFGIGAISEKNSLYLNYATIRSLDLDERSISKIINKENKELKRRIKLYRKDRAIPDLKNKKVILVDDGLATGVTAKAAIKALKKMGVNEIIFAVPVCARQSAKEVEPLIDKMVCLLKPDDLRAIGFYYDNFEQTTDEEVLHLLKKAKNFR